MAGKVVSVMAKGLNRAITPFGIKIARVHDFLPFDQTTSSAQRAGVSVSDYVDATYNVPGATQEAIDHMAELDVFTGPIDSVVEIGPGSGRYLEKVMRMVSPSRYEIYETAAPWAEYLVRTYGVIWQPTDGRSLRSTASNSADLIQAHKVFVITAFLTTCEYWLEMLRVSRPRAQIVFDAVTEPCMDGDTLDRWFEWRTADNGNYPAIIPRQFAVDFFEHRGASLVGSFYNPMKPGMSETFVFRVA
jgi:hypothetical protein